MASRKLSTIVCADSFDDYGMTLSISNDGDVYAIGLHAYAHGFTEESPIFPPKKIPSLQKIISVKCSEQHTICLDNCGNVFTFGSNVNGQLGIGDDCISTHEPQIIDIPPIKQISCGEGFSMCLTNDGFLYSFGDNYYGQLGHGHKRSLYYPTKIPSLKDVEFVECGSNHVFCKTLDEIYGWGINAHGQLGLGNMENQNAPYKCANWPHNVVDIKCGWGHTIVLTSDQEVFSCGDGASGQLGRESSGYPPTLEIIQGVSEIIRIECGWYSSLCIDIYDNIYVFGGNYCGQLGLDNDMRTVSSPIKHPSLSNVIDVSSGGYHTFIKTSNNEIFAFGDNTHSQLGIKTENEYQYSPIRVFEDNEDIWNSNLNRPSKAKSARF